MVPTKLLLLDWDDTVAKRTGSVDFASLKQAIKTKITDDWLVGLNSDTPLKRLRSWAESLGMNGPVIAEKGAVVWCPRGDESIVSQAAGYFATLRTNIVHLLTATPNITLYFGDNTSFVNTVKNVGGADSTLVALDSFRVCSIGLFVREIRGGVAQLSVAAARRIRDLIVSIQPPDPAVKETIHLDEHYCFLSLRPNDATKRLGLSALLERCRTLNNVVMIGDSIDDFLGSVDEFRGSLTNLEHWAVGNADPRFKAKATRVSELSHCDGCIELLQQA